MHGKGNREEGVEERLKQEAREGGARVLLPLKARLLLGRANWTTFG